MAAFCLIHGQWHDGSCWEPVSDGLRARGHEVVAPDLPSDDASADYEARVRPALEAIYGMDEPIIVGHSNGSADAALLAAKVRPGLLIYLCPRFGSFPVPPEAPPIFRENFPFPPKGADGRSVWDPEAAIAVMYPRLTPDTARELANRLRPGAAPVGAYPLDRHPTVPVELIYAPDDEFFTPEWEEFVAREMLGVEPIAISGGHFPMAEDPEGLAVLLDRLSGPYRRRPAVPVR